jgi:two-component system sensor histidine kinase/response regulator
MISSPIGTCGRPPYPAALVELQRAVAAATPFDLVLLDVMMPELDGFTVAERIRALPHTADVALLMLTSSGQLGDATRCRSLRIDDYLIKPIKQSDLLDAILNAVGSRAPVAEPMPSPAVDVVACRPLQVLLVEDNAVNQKLVQRMLKPLGHTVTVADNGRAAVAAFEQQRFDLVLMDVQMPEMDGFEATGAIRASECASGDHIPIIAMTAHAMKGDRERCLGAGMDAYIAKPVDRRELLATLARFASPLPQAPTALAEMQMLQPAVRR